MRPTAQQGVAPAGPLTCIALHFMQFLFTSAKHPIYGYL